MNTQSELDIKNLFTLFGAAYYHSECLHRELCSLYAIGSFESRMYLTKPRIEEKYARAYKLTLGQLIQEVQPVIPSDLYQKLQYAVEQRNFLAHHFWFERIHLVYTDSGIAALSSELNQTLALFSQLDTEAHSVLEPMLRDIGVTDETLQNSFDTVLAGEDNPLMTQRPLKKQETIVHIWDIPTTTGGTALLFETDDHEFWQLCDVGLGWSYNKGLQSDWKTNDKVKPHLPAIINPRPKSSTAWNYEFQLNRAVLWVKPGKLPNTFNWGIRLHSSR